MDIKTSTMTTHSRTVSRASNVSSDSQSSSNNIKVIARFRPENELERSLADHGIIVEFPTEDMVKLDYKDVSTTFTFDRVFDCDSKQSDVFEYSLRPTVDDLLKGYNGTVLAYGQTGSGKSHTMMGPSLDDQEMRGAIPRIVDLIFEMIEKSPSDIEYMVRVSYMEIYMEKIKDLLLPSNDNLPIHEEKARGVHVKGLTETYVSSAEEVFDVMRQGTSARSVASTNMNSESSRSHSIFCIVVSQKNITTGSQKSGQLFLVDLAGSEKVGKTGASGQTLEEAKKINKSLSALGNVINALTDGKSVHVPYRDSKLTRILQESLGGNSRTSLIVNCSPSSFNDQETISTLRFGTRAKTIRNKAKINAELSPTELRAILKKVQGQLDARLGYEQKLENELVQWRNGANLTKSDWVEFLPSLSANLNRPSSPTVALFNSPTASRFQYNSSPVQTPLRRLRNIDSVASPGNMAFSPGTDLDPIEEYLQRENDLQDTLSARDNLIEALQRELELRESSHGVECDRLVYEKKELAIKCGTLEDENKRLTEQINTAKDEADKARWEGQEKLKSLELKAAGENRKASYISEEGMIDEGVQFDVAPTESWKGREVIKQYEQKFQDLISKYQKPSSDSDAMELFKERCNINDETIASLMLEIDNLTKECNNLRIGSKLNSANSSPLIGDDSSSRRSSFSSTTTTNDRIQAMQTHISQFEGMRQKLMRDLQDRCEKIVELEVSLDQAREQYSLAFESNNSKQQQRKISILQRNLEQLTHVQRQVIEQNSALKNEVAVNQKLLQAKSQRIKELERSLSRSEAELAREQSSYDTKVGFLKDRIMEIRNHKPVPTANMGLKIVKPLRGGGSD